MAVVVPSAASTSALSRARSMALLALLAVMAGGCDRGPVTLGFWFDDVTFESPVLGGRITADDLRVVEGVARQELALAFRKFDIAITASRNVRYRVRVAQELYGNPLVRRYAVAGESRSLPLVGAFGAVNFTYFAAGAIVFAAEGISRPELLAAIGRGVGRGAVHEFAHQLVGGDLHATRDRGSYEYRAASRVEQYYGPMHWDVAGPLLRKQYTRPDVNARRSYRPPDRGGLWPPSRSFQVIDFA